MMRHYFLCLSAAVLLAAPCVSRLRADNYRPADQLQFYEKIQRMETVPKPSRADQADLKERGITYKGWTFLYQHRGAFELTSPKGETTRIENDPYIILVPKVAGATPMHYGNFRRRQELLSLGNGLVMIVHTVGQNAESGRGYVDEVAILDDTTVIHIRNLYSDAGDAHASSGDYPALFFSNWKRKYANVFPERHTDWLFWNGTHFVDNEGRVPNPPSSVEQPQPKRAPDSERFDRNPPELDFVYVNPRLARKLGVSPEELRFALLYRQTLAAAACTSDPDLQELGRTRLAKAREEANVRIAQLERKLRDSALAQNSK
ncbi:MAG TPA: hypothetical protein VMG10_24510 [Gemmataceae bacterium]|nr:hypothetical protein [Gemmataceae bacterium]